MHPDTHLELYRMEHAARARALQRHGPQPRTIRPARTRGEQTLAVPCCAGDSLTAEPNEHDDDAGRAAPSMCAAGVRSMSDHSRSNASRSSASLAAENARPGRGPPAITWTTEPTAATPRP